MRTLYAAVTDTTDIISISVSDSHQAQVSNTIIEARLTGLDIGDDITVDIGYDDSHAVVFTGYVKDIQLKEPERFYTITASNVMIRAAEFYIVSANPEDPMKRQNIDAAELVRDLMNAAGLMDVDYDLTSFMLGITTPIEINLVTSYDYSKYICDLIAWNLWADVGGGINFYRRFPWVTEEDVPVETISTPEILSVFRGLNDKDLRNRVVVYGMAGIYAEASVESPYLPEGYYRTSVVSAPDVIDSQEMADLSVDYNLELYNKLTNSLGLTVLGRPDIIPRTVITVDYPAMEGASGDWYVYSVEHTFGKAGFTTALELRRYEAPA